MADENNPKDAFSAEQVEKLNAMMGQAVNNMFTARMATIEKKILDKTSSTIGEALKAQLPELLKEFRPSEDPDPKGKGGKRGEDAVEMATLKKQIADLLKSNESERAARVASEAKRREMERQRVMLDVLAKGGVTDPFKQELAIAYLDRNQRVSWSGDEDDASLLWNDGVNPVSFNEGIASWFKSEEAKHFMPPSGTKGSGSRPTGGNPPTQGGKPTREQQWEIVGNALKEGLQNL